MKERIKIKEAKKNTKEFCNNIKYKIYEIWEKNKKFVWFNTLLSFLISFLIFTLVYIIVILNIVLIVSIITGIFFLFLPLFILRYLTTRLEKDNRETSKSIVKILTKVEKYE